MRILPTLLSSRVAGAIFLTLSGSLNLTFAATLPTGSATPYSPPPAATAAPASAAPVQMFMNGQPAKADEYAPAEVESLVLDNGIVKITFGKDTLNDFSATSVMKGTQELAHNLNGVQPRDAHAQRTFYHDFSGSNGYLHADTVKIIKNTPDLVHFAIIGNNNPRLEDHFVMLKGESGIHPYVIIHGSSNGEMRTMYRFDMNLLDWTWTPERTDQQRSYAFLQSISREGNAGDETWRLADGTIYSKYDWCLYYAEAPMFGHYGHGYGAFFMPVSNESYAGGPLRQDLAVHQDALILNYLGGGHLGSGGPAGGRNGEKLHGPWFVYFNSGDSPKAIIEDALKVAAAEQKKWPYKWMEEALFPLDRTTVTGQLKLSHNRPASNAYVILAQSGNAGGRTGGNGNGGAQGTGRNGRGNRGNGGAPAAGDAAPAAVNSPAIARNAGIFGQAAPTQANAAPAENTVIAGAPPRGQRGNGPAVQNTGQVQDRASAVANQGGDYIYYVKTDADGKFTLPNVRPNTYTLYAWQTQGPVTESLAKDGIEVKGPSLNLGVIDWDATYHPTVLWQIGQPDRLAGEYKFGDQPRTNQWLLQVPADMTFTIGKSKEATDWFYAQKTGTWTVKFNVDKVPAGNAYLTLALAGGYGSAVAAVNGTELGGINYARDASVDRAANRSGRYERNEYTFPASLLKPGENTLTLRASGTGSGGLMYDTIVMEAD